MTPDAAANPPSSHLILRTAAPADRPALSALSAAARARYRTLPGFAAIAAAPPVAPERFADGEALVAYRADDPAPLGFALLRPLDGLLYLDNISVAADASGQGIGRALLAGVERRRAALGLPAVTLTTFRAPPWNGPWFRRQGFRPLPAERIGPGLAAVIARQSRSLDPATREVLWRVAEGL
ncbi:GNAT family N-acetyltransferase [Azorhizobium doebereinerae]|uniref:GNAT family N-acetyltransferase n=1 Tax=Azorhizobium doebereinerae TaxID=281091 RepID=UPI000401748D|nr:GNAT family N-acetyltransferase [Azorhizobium doebereinerae]